MKSGGRKSMKGKCYMIYDNIKLKAAPFSYELKFLDRITLVRGDSATGKTYLYQLNYRLAINLNQIFLSLRFNLFINQLFLGF